MHAFSSKVFLGLFYAVSIALCAPHPTQNLDAGTAQTPPQPVLNTFRRLRKRSKLGDAEDQARKAVDVGSSGGTKLVGDVLKLQHDLEGILKQMKDAGMIPGSKKDKDAKHNATVAVASSKAEGEPSEGDEDHE
ncbi:hypothetical protein PCASD_17224 [Puccinia coronata f. sp. avenae]|uniref:Uncharacterized protein n=1 Tax=Puccinia coronata f. sp. avenae TaxID=200324 RepID=A0A2N5T2Z3_9BASI|nr:hypothetical protein PCASD_17224 [Puccinia coronata f. sp. avenae]